MVASVVTVNDSHDGLVGVNLECFRPDLSQQVDHGTRALSLIRPGCSCHHRDRGVLAGDGDHDDGPPHDDL